MMHAYYSQTQFDKVKRRGDAEFPYLYYKTEKGDFVQVTSVYENGKPVFPDAQYLGLVDKRTCKAYKKYVDPSTIVE